MKQITRKDIEYDEDNDCFILNVPKENVKESMEGFKIMLPVIPLLTSGLWRITRYNEYKKWLWEKQEGVCKDCPEKLEYPLRQGVSYCHHDPPLGKEGARFIDVDFLFGLKGITKNRVLCKKCHEKAKHPL